jgi:hypothetical protein
MQWFPLDGYRSGRVPVATLPTHAHIGDNDKRCCIDRPRPEPTATGVILRG